LQQVLAAGFAADRFCGSRREAGAKPAVVCAKTDNKTP
jgi:hypothetical protein